MEGCGTEDKTTVVSQPRRVGRLTVGRSKWLRKRVGRPDLGFPPVLANRGSKSITNATIPTCLPFPCPHLITAITNLIAAFKTSMRGFLCYYTVRWILLACGVCGAFSQLHIFCGFVSSVVTKCFF